MAELPKNAPPTQVPQMSSTSDFVSDAFHIIQEELPSTSDFVNDALQIIHEELPCTSNFVIDAVRRIQEELPLPVPSVSQHLDPYKLDLGATNQ